MGSRFEVKPQAGMQTNAFLALQYGVDEMLMGGMAGPGKSWTLLAMDLPVLLKDGNARSLILRRTTPDLGNLIEKACELYLPFGAEFRALDTHYKRSSFTFPNGAKVVLGHMEYEQDKEKYQGMEFPLIRFDEVTQFLESQYRYMWSRLRTKHGLKTNMACTCNPTGIGMMWVKRRWIDVLKQYEVGWFQQKDGADVRVDAWTKGSKSRVWIPGKRSENCYIGSDYEDSLRQLGTDDFRALGDGLWEIQARNNQLIDPRWIDFAMSGKVKPLTGMASSWNAIGCDYAHSGKDKTILVHGLGNRVDHVDEEAYSRAPETAQRIFALVAKLGRFRTMVGLDSNGPGSGVADILEDTLGLGDCLNRCVYKDKDYIPTRKGAFEFDCLRSQMWWQFKLDLEDGNIDLSRLAQAFDDYNGVMFLMEELYAHEMQVVNGKMRVTSKKEMANANRLGRSPDRADALVIWNWVRKRSSDDVESYHENEEVRDYGRKSGGGVHRAKSAWL